MFGFLKKKKEIDAVLAPIEGEAVLSSQVNDPTFAEEMLGKGLAIKPEDGKVYAPVDGTIGLLFDTKHAVSFLSEQGAEILVHVGLDTVALKGEYYTAHVKTGDSVKQGDLVLEFDMDGIKGAGYDLITPVIICNSDEYKEIKVSTGMKVKPGDTIIELEHS